MALETASELARSARSEANKYSHLSRSVVMESTSPAPLFSAFTFSCEEMLPEGPKMYLSNVTSGTEGKVLWRITLRELGTSPLIVRGKVTVKRFGLSYTRTGAADPVDGVLDTKDVLLPRLSWGVPYT